MQLEMQVRKRILSVWRFKKNYVENTKFKVALNVFDGNKEDFVWDG